MVTKRGRCGRTVAPGPTSVGDTVLGTRSATVRARRRLWTICSVRQALALHGGPLMPHSKRLSRRAVPIGRIAAVGAAMTAGCGSSSPTSPTTGASSAATSGGGGASGACVATPSETAGPYPDRLGMLGNSAFFRRDVTEGRPGTPLALTLTILNTASGCTALANANVEIWQCDAAGAYSNSTRSLVMTARGRRS